MRYLNLSLLLLLMGCSIPSISTKIETNQLCGVESGEIEMKRISFKGISSLKSAVCNKSSSAAYFESSDKVQISVRTGFQSAGIHADASSFSFVVDGRLHGGRLGELLPPDEFEVFRREHEEYPRMRRVLESEQVERAGLRCVRFLYSHVNDMRKAQELEYWCWENVSGMAAPFRVSALEAVSPSGKWKYDLDADFLDPFFSTVEFKPLPGDLLQRVEGFYKDDCLQNKNFFDSKGVGWLAADYPNNRRALLLMNRCGYSIEVPPYDGLPLVPTVSKLWNRSTEKSLLDSRGSY